MASSTRNHVIKTDLAANSILARIATNSLIPEKYDALYYEILKGLDLPNLPAHKQMAGILFSATTCNIVNKIDCRQLITDADFQEKLIEFQSIDDLWTQWFKLFDKLNSGQMKERIKEVEEAETNIGIGEQLQKMLSKHLNDDSRPNNTDN